MKKILAVDDSVSIRKSISFILGNEGYEVVEAEDGVGVEPVPCGEGADAVVGPIQDAVSVDDHELHGKSLLPAS